MTMILGLPCLPLEDFHTRLLDEHWDCRYAETKEQIQLRIEEIMKAAEIRVRSEARVTNGIAIIPLNQGNEALVDVIDLPRLLNYRWRICTKKNGQVTGVRTACYLGPYTYKTVFMHRMIIEAPEGMEIDHINRNPLDNRRSNLRVCTRSQNQQNRRPKRGFKYKGVFKDRGKYRAAMAVNKVRFWTKSFDTEEEAAMAYDSMALKHHGEFVYLNFPEQARDI